MEYFLRYIVGKIRKIARVSLHSWNSYEIFLEVCLLWIKNIQVQFQFLNGMDITPGSLKYRVLKQPLDVTKICKIYNSVIHQCCLSQFHLTK